MEKLIISACICGAEVTKEQNPNVPYTVEEIVSCLLYTSVTEKSSKLMESMLVAVKPAAIILGKLLAITLTGIIQLFSWIFGLAISFFIGSKIVLSINPDTDMMIIQGFKMLGNMAEGILSPANCIMALLMIMTGMLLYCALAGAGGAMASKAEDLSSANAIFSLVLVASFLVSIYAGGVMEGDMTDSILDWIPFTSVMITPAKVLICLLDTSLNWCLLCRRIPGGRGGNAVLSGGRNI